MRTDKQPTYLQRAMWYFTPSQSSVLVQATHNEITSESYPSTRLSNLGHVLYALFWVGAVLLYSVLIIFQYFSFPDPTSFTQEPSASFGYMNVSISAWCTRGKWCGDILISADYRTGPDNCKGVPVVEYRYPAGTRMAAPVPVPLCYTGEHMFSTNNNNPMPANLGIIIDFSKVDPGYMENGTGTGHPATAAVRIQNLDANSPLNKVINLESWQVKSTVMGHRVNIEYDKTVAHDAYTVATQYEGRRNTWRATSIVSLGPYADVTRTWKRRSLFTDVIGVMSLIGTCAGMAFLMNSLQVVWDPIFLKLFPGPALLAERAAEAQKQSLSDLEKELNKI